MTATIKQIRAREILDSRGIPTIETVIRSSSGHSASASVPSGASTGSYEAWELRDGDLKRFNGKGVLKACRNVNQILFPILKSLRLENLDRLEQLMIDRDGTKNKSRLGANAILSVSFALYRLAALTENKPLYRYLHDAFDFKKKFYLPRPTFNVINAGRHGTSPIEFQEFHLLPYQGRTFANWLRIGQLVYLNLGKLLKQKGLSAGLGDEGGYSPNLLTNLDAFELLRQAVKVSGLQLGKDVYLGLDSAASTFMKNGQYRIRDFASALSGKMLLQYYVSLAKRFRLRYLEDGFSEDDWPAWQALNKKMGDQLMIVGDDLLTTNEARIRQAQEKDACNAILVKPNQIGTIKETVRAVRLARECHWQIIISHRSGETTDDFIADFAVGVNADLVKFGAPARGERVSKYNRLLAIEEELQHL